MEIKEKPNHHIYLKMLSRMTPAQRLNKAFELSDQEKKFPEKTDAEIKVLYLKRIMLCHNRNY